MYKLNLFLILMLFFNLPFGAYSQTENNSNQLSIDELLALLGSGEPISDKTLVVNEINFDFAKSSLTENAKTYLTKIVRLLTVIDNMALSISGHTDNIGDPASNLKLSKERALSVYHFIIENGIDASRLSYKGVGDTQPIASNDNDLGRTKNRRVEFSITQTITHSENTQLQDVVYLKDGRKFGAYNVIVQNGILYYESFHDGTKNSIRLSNIESINYSNGTTYNQPKTNSYSSENNYTKTKSYVQNIGTAIDYFWLNGAYLKLGYRRWNVFADEVYFHFIDDSPSQDNIENTIKLNKGGVTIDLGLEWNLRKNDFIFGYKGYGGKVHGGMVNFGYAFRIIDADKWMLRAGASFDWAWANINLGRIENNGLYIQINQQQFYDESISVRLKKNYTMFSPKLTADFPAVMEDIFLRFSLGYNLQLTSSSNETLYFTGYVGDEVVEETKTLSLANKATFKADEVVVERVPIRFSGLFLSAGLAIRIN